jgi:hypothetical protein
VEVLISILVLGLGLLGLAAVFPAVTVQQRSATDAVEGGIVADSAVTILKTHDELTEYDQANTSNRPGWRVLTNQATWSPAGQWDVPGLAMPPQSGASRVMMDRNTGETRIMDGGNIEMVVPAETRVSPTPTAAQGTNNNPAVQFERSRYVWDFAARRAITPGKTPTVSDPVQVAVFVRRVDPSIRRSVGVGVVPVASRGVGIPTFDGRAQQSTGTGYATIQRGVLLNVLPAAGNDRTPRVMTDLVRIEENDALGINKPELNQYVNQLGQMFVDTAGNVASVVEVTRLDNGDINLKLDRAIRIDTPGNGPEGGTALVLYTPAIPAAVRTMLIQAALDATSTTPPPPPL